MGQVHQTGDRLGGFRQACRRIRQLRHSLRLIGGGGGGDAVAAEAQELRQRSGGVERRVEEGVTVRGGRVGLNRPKPVTMPMARAVRWKTGSGTPLNAAACRASPSASAIFPVDTLPSIAIDSAANAWASAAPGSTFDNRNRTRVEFLLAASDVQADVERLPQQRLQLGHIEDHWRIGRHGTMRLRRCPSLPPLTPLSTATNSR